MKVGMRVASHRLMMKFSLAVASVLYLVVPRVFATVTDVAFPGRETYDKLLKKRKLGVALFENEPVMPLQEDFKASILKACLEGDLDTLKRRIPTSKELYLFEDSPRRLNSPLCLAVKNGHVEVVRYLVGLGANPSSGNPRNSPIRIATQRQDLTVLEIFFGVSDLKISKERILLEAAEDGLATLLQYLLNRKGVRQDVYWGEDSRGFAIHRVSSKPFGPHNFIIPLLIKNDPKCVELKDQVGRTPLHLAAKVGNEEGVKMLLDANADINARAWDGDAPFHAAARAGFLKTLGLLLEKRPEIKDSGDGKNRTLFMYAIEHGKDELFAFLLEKNAASSRADITGMNPAMLAACLGKAEIVKRLFEISPKEHLYSVDCSGKNLLHVACKSGQIEVVEMLLSLENIAFDLHARDIQGNAPIHLAAIKKHQKIVDLLISKDPELKYLVDASGRDYDDLQNIAFKLSYIQRPNINQPRQQ